MARLIILLLTFISLECTATDNINLMDGQELANRMAEFNLRFIPISPVNDRDTQLARLQDYMVADRDPEAAFRVKQYYGKNMPIGKGMVDDEAMEYFVGAAVARNMGIAETPGDFWLEQGKEIPKAEQQDDLFGLMGREMIQAARARWDEEHSKPQPTIEPPSSPTPDEQIEKIRQETISAGVTYTLLATIGSIALFALIYYLWDTRKNYHTRPFPLICCLLLAIAICPLPYGYYRFLRIILTIWGILTIWHTHTQAPPNKAISLITIISGGIAVLYNPILPIYLDKATWTILNLISIPCILIATHLTRAKSPNTPQPAPESPPPGSE